MAENRDEFLARVAAEHDAWEQDHLDTAPFNPESRPDGSDYNLWNVDMDAAAAAQQQLVDAIGTPDVAVDDIPEDLLDLTEDNTTTEE